MWYVNMNGIRSESSGVGGTSPELATSSQVAPATAPQSTSAPAIVHGVLSASADSDVNPLQIVFSYKPIATSDALSGSFTIDFGDGESGAAKPDEGCNRSVAAGCYLIARHTYGSSGTYNVILKETSGTTLGTSQVKVVSVSRPTATISQGLVLKSQTGALNGGASNVSTIKIEIWVPASAKPSGYSLWTSGVATVKDGAWFFNLSNGSDAKTMPPGTYKVDVLDWDSNSLNGTQLAEQTVTVANY